MPSEVAVDVHRVIGYRIAASEQWIEVPQGTSIQTIWVAFRSEGLTAFGLDRGPGVARGMLKIPGNLNQSCVFAGLDSYKATHPPIHEGLSISALWPQIPPPRFEPALNIDFGGQAGPRLGKLTRFVFYMASGGVPFIGLEVGFSDDEPMLFGSRVGFAMPFFIDGAGGERIVQLSTNYGRTATFAPLDPYPDTVVENIPLPTPDSQWMRELEDGFELGSDEDMRLLTICVKPVRNSADNPAMEQGQVVSVHIETTRARSVTIRSPDFGFHPAQLTHHQYQSDGDGSLIAIIWILNPISTPPYDQIQKIYFDRASANGNRENVLAVEAYFRDCVIIGLEFVYTSGRKAKTGIFETDTHRTYRFPPDARIIRTSATTVKEQLTELQFEIERETDPSPVRRLVGSIKSSDDPIGDVNPLRDVWREVWCPREMLVGMSVSCTYFSKVGAVYEPEGEQQEGKVGRRMSPSSGSSH
ncbi:hypothetical protein BJX68DRAFT_258873 [Aspergillus pseudodeflectus]|uniref:Uncharacterized protein n=1 Tax=Aspergillus pseudodeflectus TaxID=176178 RepID=A0ABR4JHE4_9EURO